MKPTTEQQEKAAKRRAAMRELARTIHAMTEDERLEIAMSYPIITIEGRPLSVFNQCMVASQMESATVVGGFRQWLKAGRVVRKGEHGLAIWVPTTQKVDSDRGGEEEETRFLMGTVFDVTQTDELPTTYH